MTNKELYEDYCKRDTHPWLTVVEKVYDEYVKIWNSTVVKHSSNCEDRVLYQYCDYKEVDDDTVYFYGEETWQYGGYAEHEVYIPLEFFFCEDGSKLQELRLTREKRKAAVEESRHMRGLEYKRKTLDKLKRELGEK